MSADVDGPLARLKAETELIEARTAKLRAETTEKLSAEVSKVLAETVRLSEAQRESGPRFAAEVEKMNAEAAKARAEARKLSRERGWFPYVTITTSLITLATVIFTAYKLLHP